MILHSPAADESLKSCWNRINNFSRLVTNQLCNKVSGHFKTSASIVRSANFGTRYLLVLRVLYLLIMQIMRAPSFASREFASFVLHAWRPPAPAGHGLMHGLGLQRTCLALYFVRRGVPRTVWGRWTGDDDYDSDVFSGFLCNFHLARCEQTEDDADLYSTVQAVVMRLLTRVVSLVL
jgi:hypothetical protein